MFGGAMPMTTTVQSAAPSDTSACVRIPAGLPRTSRSIPIPLPITAAANNRSTSSEVSGGREAMRSDCRSHLLFATLLFSLPRYPLCLRFPEDLTSKSVICNPRDRRILAARSKEGFEDNGCGFPRHEQLARPPFECLTAQFDLNFWFTRFRAGDWIEAV